MTTGILTLPEIERRLITAETPKQAHDIEAAASAAKAWHDEQGHYEESMQAWRLYYMARRKTTELIDAGNMDVTDIGWNKMQWSRRRRELEVPQETLDEYFDDLIAKTWHPSINGLLRHSSGEEIDRRERARADMLRGANTLINEFYDESPAEEIKAAEAVRKAFA